MEWTSPCFVILRPENHEAGRRPLHQRQLWQRRADNSSFDVLRHHPLEPPGSSPAVNAALVRELRRRRKTGVCLSPRCRRATEADRAPLIDRESCWRRFLTAGQRLLFEEL